MHLLFQVFPQGCKIISTMEGCGLRLYAVDKGLRLLR